MPPRKRRKTEKIERPQSRSPSAMASIKSIEESLGSMKEQFLQMQQLNDNFVDSARQLIASSHWSAHEIQILKIETEQRLALFNDVVKNLTSGFPNSGHHTPITTGNPSSSTLDAYPQEAPFLLPAFAEEFSCLLEPDFMLKSPPRPDVATEVETEVERLSQREQSQQT